MIEEESEKKICPHCGKIGRPLGLCWRCGDPVCEQCGHKVGDKVEHFPEWCWSVPMPERREGGD